MRTGAGLIQTPEATVRTGGSYENPGQGEVV